MYWFLFGIVLLLFTITNKLVIQAGFLSYLVVMGEVDDWSAFLIYRNFMNENELLIKSIKLLVNKIDILISVLIDVNTDDVDVDEEAEKEATKTYLDGSPIA